MCLSLYTQKVHFFLNICICTHDWEGQEKTVDKSGFSFYPMFWGLNSNLAASAFTHLASSAAPEVYSIYREAAVVKFRVHFGVGQYIFLESGMLNSYGWKGNLQARQRWSQESTVGVDRVKDYSTELGWNLKKSVSSDLKYAQILHGDWFFQYSHASHCSSPPNHRRLNNYLVILHLPWSFPMGWSNSTDWVIRSLNILPLPTRFSYSESAVR